MSNYKTARKALKNALQRHAFAVACVKENTGYDRELAREGVEHCLAEELFPTIVVFVESMDGSELKQSKVQALGDALLKATLVNP